MHSERIIVLRRLCVEAKLQPQTLIVGAKWFSELRDALSETLDEIVRLQERLRFFTEPLAHDG